MSGRGPNGKEDFEEDNQEVRVTERGTRLTVGTVASVGNEPHERDERSARRDSITS
jgi:hypothetical protein